jgi:hypothetical protein
MYDFFGFHICDADTAELLHVNVALQHTTLRWWRILIKAIGAGNISDICEKTWLVFCAALYRALRLPISRARVTEIANLDWELIRCGLGCHHVLPARLVTL